MRQVSRRDLFRLSTGAAASLLLASCTTAPAAPTAAPKPAEPTAAPKPAEATAVPKPAAQAATPQPAAPTAVPQAEPQVWPRGDVPRERTFIRAFGYQGGALENVGVKGAYCQNYSHQQSGAFEQEGLAYYSAYGDKTYPWLSESYEYNDDATELTIHMRKGAEWSDGTPLTAKDVAFTINMLIANAPTLRNSAVIKNATKSAEAVDDYTVKVVLNQTDWRYFFRLFTFRYDLGTYIIPEHIYKDVDDPFAFKFFDAAKGWPVVSGPFQCVEYDETHQTLDRRYDWWAEKTGLMTAPNMDRIIQVPMGNNEIAAMKCVNNEVDTTFMLPASLIQSVISYAPQVITHTGREKPFGYLDWWPNSLYFNCLEWPYDDARVRWAMAYAINQQELVDVGQMGSGLVSEWIFPTYAGLQKYFDATKSIREKYNVLEVNLEKTDALMTEAGFAKDAEGFWAKDGKRPPAQIFASAQHFGDIAPLLVEQLRTAGFDATHASPPDVWNVCAVDGILHFQGHTGSVRDPYQTFSYYTCEWVTPTGENYGVNKSRWCNPEFDAIVEKIGLLPIEDYDAITELTVQAAEIWYRELPEVPLVQFLHRIPYNTTYWKNWPTQDNPYVNGADFHLTGVMLMWGTGLQPA